ncbi:uncharacterized protein G2W53_027990 [Senna tora]|uniref:Uncharacterized protein n=1 Tax=Senna tora TaxID=362788 RepID=A0A834T4C4_9FABA|nr:uncharacterized protein G2W53_027990 [Senna tora]
MVRKMKVRWVKLQYICMVRRVKEYYRKVVKDMADAGNSIDQFQQRVFMESTFAIPVGLSFSTSYPSRYGPPRHHQPRPLFIAITRLKEDKMPDPLEIENLMPLKANSEDKGHLRMEKDSCDEKNWMSSAQLWSTQSKLVIPNFSFKIRFDSQNLKNRGGTFLPFNGKTGGN